MSPRHCDLPLVLSPKVFKVKRKTYADRARVPQTCTKVESSWLGKMTSPNPDGFDEDLLKLYSQGDGDFDKIRESTMSKQKKTQVKGLKVGARSRSPFLGNIRSHSPRISNPDAELSSVLQSEPESEKSSDPMKGRHTRASTEDILGPGMPSGPESSWLTSPTGAWAYPGTGNIEMDSVPCKMVGLVNLGNTCYLNSILQALFCSKMFTDLVAATSKSCCQPVTTSLRKVFNCLKLNRKNSANPKHFLEASRPPWFHDGQQQDCSEFLTFLFQKLEEEHNSEVMEQANNNTDIMWEKCVGNHGGGDIRDKSDHGLEVVDLSPSIVQSVYGGAQVVKYQCSGCSTMSQVETRFTTLDLPLSTTAEEPRGNISVENLIKDYLEPETLNRENQYQCDTCHRLTDAVKTTRMKMLPRHLIITLLRFMFDISSSRKEKLLTRVEVPTTLHLSGSQEGLVKYELYCVIVHSGLSSEVGHYYTLVRQSGVWTKVSDEVVETVYGRWDKDLHSMSDTPYMLFYQKEEVAPKN